MHLDMTRHSPFLWAALRSFAVVNTASVWSSGVEAPLLPKVLDLDGVASVVENTTMIRVTLVCGRALADGVLLFMLELTRLSRS